MNDLRFILSALVHLVGAAGFVLGCWGAVEIFSSRSARDGNGQREGAMRIMAGIGIVAIATAIGQLGA